MPLNANKELCGFVVLAAAQPGAVRPVQVGLDRLDLGAQRGPVWLVYGGFYLYLYILKGEGAKGEYDARWPKRDSRVFLFGHQVSRRAAGRRRRRTQRGTRPRRQAQDHLNRREPNLDPRARRHISGSRPGGTF
jgi:hypothetical protein